MTFNLNFFLAAVGLLWLPLPYMARRDKAYSNRGRVTASTIPGLWRAWQNWVDIIRSAAGTYALMELSIGSDPTSNDVSLATLIKEGILFVGLLMQTIRFGSTQGFLLPLFYLTGMTLVLSEPMESGVAVVLAWGLAFGTKDPRFVLPVIGLSLLITGYILGDLGRSLFVNVALVFAPLMMALLFQKRVLFVSREQKSVSAKKQPLEQAAPPPKPTKPPENAGKETSRMQIKSRSSTAGR